MDGKRFILFKHSWKTWLEVLINYTKGRFMDVADFNFKTSTMTRPYYTSWKYSGFVSSCIWKPLFMHEVLEQILVTCSLKVSSISVFTTNNTSSLLAFIADPIIYIGRSTNGHSKKLDFSGSALKPWKWNYSQILGISFFSFSIIPSKPGP